MFGPQRCPVYPRLPWKGRRPVSFVESTVVKAVESCYRTCSVKVVYGSRPAFPGCVKDILPTHNKSNVIYLFECRCGSRYVGKTTQRLENRIQQHLPSATKSSSAIGEHLLRNPDCLDKFDRSMFSIVCKARTESVLHDLELMFIKSIKPDLCKKMQFVKVLHLFSNT